MSVLDVGNCAGVHLEAPAVIFDHQSRPVDAEVQRQGRPAGVGMLVDVGQCFLDDPEKGDGGLRRELLASGRADLGMQRDPGRLLEVAAEIDHPFADLLFLHDDRPQLVDEGPHLREHVVRLLDGARQHGGHPIRLGSGQIPSVLELEAKGIDVLHQSVVHIPGDPVSLGHHRHLVLLILDARLQPQALHAERELAADLVQQFELRWDQPVGIGKAHDQRGDHAILPRNRHRRQHLRLAARPEDIIEQ